MSELPRTADVPPEVLHEEKKKHPQQQDRQPGIEKEMVPEPQPIKSSYKGANKLQGKVALVTGGDSGIGRAICLHFAREGVRGLALLYKNEHEDASKTVNMIQAEGVPSVLSISGDITSSKFCAEAVDKTIHEFGALDIVVNNAGEGHPCPRFEDISPAQLQATFATNVFGMFYITRAALPHLLKSPGASIINVGSESAYTGEADNIDYAASKGSVTTFTRSLALQLADKSIRVNTVSPGPIYTPLIPATQPADKVAQFGEATTKMKRVGQPSEVATAIVFLASNCCSSYITGQALHPNGGIQVAG